jgi:hypothetical protein
MLVEKSSFWQEVLWALLAMTVFCITVIFSSPEESKIPTAKIFVGAGIFLLLVLVALALQAVEQQWRVGEKACQLREDKIKLMKSTFLTQEIVDAKMRELATAAEATFKIETQLREEVSESQLQSIAESVRVAKEQFWAAHTLANQLGFTVHIKIKDYTTI